MKIKGIVLNLILHSCNSKNPSFFAIMWILKYYTTACVVISKQLGKKWVTIGGTQWKKGKNTRKYFGDMEGVCVIVIELFHLTKKWWKIRCRVFCNSIFYYYLHFSLIVVYLLFSVCWFSMRQQKYVDTVIITLRSYNWHVKPKVRS